MHCTIIADPASRAPLSLEALESYQRLRRQALAFAALSTSFAAEAERVADAYALALMDGSPPSWAAFVAAAAALVGHTDGVGSILHLDGRERAAYEFFAQIVRENADLLDAEHFTAA